MRERRGAGERGGGGGGGVGGVGGGGGRVREGVRERGREKVSKLVLYAQSTSAVREKVNWCFTTSAVISERARARERERDRVNWCFTPSAVISGR